MFPIMNVAGGYAKAQFENKPVVKQNWGAAAFNQRTALGRNLVYSGKAIQEVRSYLTVGTNTAADCKGDYLALNELITRIREKRDDLISVYKKEHGFNVKLKTFAEWAVSDLITYGYGHCSEIALAVMVILQNSGVRSVLYCESSIGEHGLVVLGVIEGADLKNMSTWGENAVVCDAWAKKAYPLSEFTLMQLPEHNVRYPRLYEEIKNPPHYLAGELIAQIYYNAEGKWVDLRP